MAAGTKVASVWVDIQGDLTNYNKSLATAKTQAQGLGAQIKQALASPNTFDGTSPTANLVAALKRGITNGNFGNVFREALGQGGFNGIASELGSAFKGQLGNVFSFFGGGLLSAGTSAFRGIANVGKSLLSEIGKGLAVGFGITAFLGLEQVVSKLTQAIPDLINKGESYAATVKQIQNETGATVTASSQLAATFQYLGVPIDQLIPRMARLSNTVHSHEDELKALGIATRDSNGAFLNQVQIIDNVRSKLSQMTDGTAKARLEVLLFGGHGSSAIGQLIQYLQLTDAQMATLNEQFVKQGLIIDDTTTKLGQEAGRAFQNIQDSITGLAVTLFRAVGPQIIATFDGIANTIRDNAANIAATLASIVNNIIGFVQGLTGINLNFNSLAVQVQGVGDANSQTSNEVISLTEDIAAQEKSLKSLKTSASGAGGAIKDGARAAERAITDETQAVDAQIKSWTAIGVAATKALTEELARLTAVEDKQIRELDLQDQINQRAKTALSLTQQGEKAADALAKAKLVQQQAEVGIAQAQAQYNKDTANPNKDAATQADTIAKDIIAIANAQQSYRDALTGVQDAQQGIADNQTAITDNAKANAEADRRAQIQAVKDYIANVGKIVADGDNKAATLKTLHAREDKVRAEIAADKARGDTQAAADDEIRLQALVAAAHGVATQIKVKNKTDELTAKKTLLAAELEAVKQNAQDQLSAVSGASTAAKEKQRADIQAVIDKDKERLKTLLDNAAAAKIADDAQTIRLRKYGEDATHTLGNNGIVPKAFAASRDAGVTAANAVKAAFNGLLDVLLGGQLQGPAVGGGHLGRTGGVTGALQDVAGFISDIAGAAVNLSGALDGATNGDAKSKILLVTAGWAALSGNWPLAAVLLATAGIVTGFDVFSNVNSKVQANPAAAANFALGVSGATQPGTSGSGASFKYDWYNKATNTWVRASDPNWYPPPGQASGGAYSAGQAFMVGEHGPELRIENHDGYTIPNEILQAFQRPSSPTFANAEGTPVHVTVIVPWDTRAVDFISRELAYRRR